MGWFSNLFSSNKNTLDTRRRLAMSTHDAFSLPTTSSPILGSRPHSALPEERGTPDQDAANSSYVYPPMSGSPTYDYVPTTATPSSSRQNSLLPMHATSPLPPLPQYPPLDRTWARIQSWLHKEYPELGDTLNYGIAPQDLSEAELAFGFSLPQAVRDSYLMADGQEAESSSACAEGLFFGLNLLPMDEVVEEWRFWRDVDDDPSTGANPQLRALMQSVPPGWVRREYSQRGWIPLVSDKGGNYLGVDMNPGEAGAVGQVIIFGRDFDTKVVMWRGDGTGGWARWLASFAEELESGEGFELGPGTESEGSEDDIGYESYFFDGSGKAKGEGGGDLGGGGMRLAGEYRGWGVLEAWADRSVKRWKESGQFTEPNTPTLPTQDATRTGLGVLNFSLPGGTSSGAEVPIPVVSEPGEIPLAGPSKLPEQTHPLNQSLPSIAITKPPAPQPVDLPSPDDIIAPIPREPPASFDIDLERGPDTSTDENDHPLSSPTAPFVRVRSPPRQTPPKKGPAEAALISLPPESPDELPTVSEATLIETLSTSTAVADLLDGDVTVVDVDEKTLEPTHPEAPQLAEEDLKDSQSNESKANTLDADTTIRLIGGGGIIGDVADLSVEEDTSHEQVASDQAEVASITSLTSNDSTASRSKPQHTKKKSISAGLKKLGKFGSGVRTAKSDKDQSSVSSSA